MLKYITIFVSDLSLTFVALSSGTAHLTWPLLWALLAFYLLLTCGLSTCTTAVATVVTSILEVFNDR